MPFLLVGVILCALKIAGITMVAAWLWWLVTLPFWIGIAMFFVFMLIGGGLVAAFVAIMAWLERR